MSWISSYDMRPGSLFEQVAQRLSIFICAIRTSAPAVFTGGYRRWSSHERRYLFQTVGLTPIARERFKSGKPWPKISSRVEEVILSHLVGSPISIHVDQNAPAIYVHRIVRYFVKALDRAPLFVDAQGASGKSEDYKTFHVQTTMARAALACLNSSLFYWFWRSTSDGFHCGYGDVYRFPFNSAALETISPQLNALVARLMEGFFDQSAMKVITTKAGKIQYQEFYPKLSKSLVDEIDSVLMGAWGLSPESLDFIINYDIKYRMGQGDDDA